MEYDPVSIGHRLRKIKASGIPEGIYYDVERYWEKYKGLAEFVMRWTHNIYLRDEESVKEELIDLIEDIRMLEEEKDEDY